MPRLDERTWTAIATNSGPYPELLGQQFALNFPSDRLIITVTSETSKGYWIRAGYAHYTWIRDGEPFLVSTHLCYIGTSKICVIEPLESAIIAFEPVAWLKEWRISIEASVL